MGLRKTSWIVMAVGAAVLLWPARVTPVRAQAGDELARLAERLAAVERTLDLPARDATRPGIERRISTLEEGLRDLARASGQTTSFSPAENLRELRDAVRESQRTAEELARRVTQLERAVQEMARGAGQASRADDRGQRAGADVQGLARDVERLTRQVDDLARDRQAGGAAEVRDVRSGVNELKRAVDDLRSRVQRLERG
jgi:methyl-accepting chemotaxis protein